MTLAPCRSWWPQGAQLRVPYHAPEGRRVNVIGAHFTHGPKAGRLSYQSWASLPKSRAKKQRMTEAERAAAHGLQVDEVGPIDSERVLEFIWRIAGRETATESWKRERPLMVVLDNYSVHKSQVGQAAYASLTVADIHLIYLPPYSPELSRIEPDWNDLKQHHLPVRSYEQVADLKHAVDAALARKAQQLQQAYAKTTRLGHSDT